MRYQDGSFVCTFCGSRVDAARDVPTARVISMVDSRRGRYEVVIAEGGVLHRCPSTVLDNASRLDEGGVVPPLGVRQPG